MTTRKVISFHAPHHKTESRGVAPIEFELPDGELADLLLVHIKKGHKLLTQTTGEACTSLFVTATGKPFENSNFTQYWQKIMITSSNVPYFPPNLARTVFVEQYTSANGMPPEMWDGAAAVMGNHVETWGVHYNPSARKRKAQKAVDAHQALVLEGSASLVG